MVHEQYLSEFNYKYYSVNLIADGKITETLERKNVDLELIFTKRLKFKGHRPHQTGFSEFDEWFGIFTHHTTDDLNFGYIHYIPAGYSSVTYDPEITFNVYVGYSWEKFLRLGLPEPLRDIVKQRYLIRKGMGL